MLSSRRTGRSSVDEERFAADELRAWAIENSFSLRRSSQVNRHLNALVLDCFSTKWSRTTGVVVSKRVDQSLAIFAESNDAIVASWPLLPTAIAPSVLAAAVAEGRVVSSTNRSAMARVHSAALQRVTVTNLITRLTQARHDLQNDGVATRP